MPEQKSSKSTAFDLVRDKVLPKVWESLTEGTAVRRPKELLAVRTTYCACDAEAVRSIANTAKHARSERYQYESLPKPSCIRLLRVEQGTISEPIRCSLRIVDLDTDPDFVALSYSWEEDKSLISQFIHPKLALRHTAWLAVQTSRAILGWREYVSYNEHMIKQDHEMKQEELAALAASESKSFTVPQVIFCDGKGIVVKPNLYSALLRLRPRKQRDYWIDAVCINQKDIDELSSQVQMMGRIYQSAAEVIVWVGEMPRLLKGGFQKMSTKFGEVKPGSTPSKLSIKDMNFTEIEMAAIWLLTRRWFRRLWVVQESCLARRITFPIGDHDFKAEDVVSIVKWMDLGSSNPDYSFLAMILSPYATHIRSVPAMFSANMFYAGGGRRTLLEWLEMTMNRKAKEPRDIVCAGLALVEPRTLVINQELQLQEEGCNSEGPPQRLWKFLHADYKADTAFVMINLAACLLSSWNVDTLFSITLRYRPPPALCTIAESPVYLQPSWAPDPSPWNPRPNAAPRTAHRPLPLPTNMQETGPNISSDGTVLYLTAVKFDIITKHCSLEDLLSLNTNQCVLKFLNFLANTIPTVYHPTGKSGWDTVVNVVLAKCRAQGRLPEHYTEAQLRLGFCLAIDAMAKRAIEYVEKIKSSSKPELRALLDPTIISAVDAKRITTALEEIKARHSGARLPTSDEIKSFVAEEKKASYNQQTQDGSAQANSGSQTSSAENSNIGVLMAMMERHDKGNSGPKDPGAGKSDNDDATDFVKYYNEDLSTQSMFMTSQGYMGIGPNSLREGDGVFLIRYGDTPYILRHIDDALRRRCLQIRQQLERKEGKAAEEALRKEWQDTEQKIGKRDGWQLVGDAYVEGIMDGEVAAQMEERVQRYGIV